MELKTVTISSKGQIALPKSIRKIKGFREGEKVVVVAKENKVELLPADDDEAFLRSLQGSLPERPPLTRKERNEIFDEFVKRFKQD